MSVLDTFWLLFKTNAKDAAGDVGSLPPATDKAKKGLVDMDKAAVSLSGSLLDLAKDVAAPLIALASIGAALGMTVGRAAEIRELDQFASKLNDTVSNVDAFQRSVTAMGGDTSAAVDSLVKLGEKINEAFSDGESGARKDFKEWGLAFKNVKGEAVGASDGMLRLAKNLEGVSRGEALARIKKLGIEDKATIDLLLQGRRAVEDKMNAEKAQGVVTEAQAQKTRVYYAALGNVKNALTSMSNSILETVLPAMTALVTGFGKAVSWIAQNKTLVSGFFIGAATALTVYYLPAISAAATATIAATWPFIAIGAAVAAVGAVFALVYEDIVAFMDGQPSLIGSLAEKYEWFGVLVKGIGTVFTYLKNLAVAAFGEIGTVWDAVVAAFNWGADVIGKVVDALRGPVEAYLDAWVTVFNTVKPLLMALGEVFKLVGEISGAVFNKIIEAGGKLATMLLPVFQAIGTTAKAVFESLITFFEPTVTRFSGAAEAIKNIFLKVFDFIKMIWNSTIGAITSGIMATVDKIRSVLTLGGLLEGSDQAAGAATAAQVNAGSLALGGASAQPINGATSTSFALGGAVQKTNTVTIGDINVSTNATDPAGTAAAMKAALSEQFRGATSQFDDGVDR